MANQKHVYSNTIRISKELASLDSNSLRSILKFTGLCFFYILVVWKDVIWCWNKFGWISSWHSSVFASKSRTWEMHRKYTNSLSMLSTRRNCIWMALQGGILLYLKLHSKFWNTHWSAIFTKKLEANWWSYFIRKLI